nr:MULTISPECIES: DUF4244 domain-containing protein [Cryobacterium]
MTTLSSPPAPPTEHHPQAEESTGSAAAADRAAAPLRHDPSAGTGIPNALVRTRAVRSHSIRALLRLRDDRGAATAEYIVATMAAVGFAGLLIVILRGDEVRGILTELVRSALTVG